MNMNLAERPDTVPHFDYRKLQSSPKMSGQCTPRIRHFTDDVVKESRGRRKSQMQKMTKNLMGMGGAAALMGTKRKGRLTLLQDQMGLVKEVQHVSAS